MFDVLSRYLGLIVAERGWDPLPLEAALADCERAGLRLHWRGPWVRNRSGSAEALVHIFVSKGDEARGELDHRWEGSIVTFRPLAIGFDLDTACIGITIQN